MKIKRVVKLCVEAGGLTLFNHVDGGGALTQWMSDSGAMYPMYGMPVLDEDTVCTVFDISEKTVEKMNLRAVDMPEALDVGDASEGEKICEMMDVAVKVGGDTLVPLTWAGGGCFINKKYLAPLMDVMDEVQLFYRTSGDYRCIVAKVGLLISGVILPAAVSEDLAGKLGACVEIAEGRIDEDG